MNHPPVDAVIAWVDGHDPLHIDKLASYLTQIGLPRPVVAASPTRFNECGEIRYCIWSLLRYAPWIRTIFIVTDSQTPSVVAELRGTPYEKKVVVVDERCLFSGLEAHLPTFNCIAIETLLWRIPGLSEHFLYLNDDWSLLRPVAYHDFFREDKVVLRGEWKTQSAKSLGRHLRRAMAGWFTPSARALEPDIYRITQENSAQCVGWHRRFFHLPHAPLPVRKQTLVDFFNENPERLLQNVQYRFRDKAQYLPLSLAHHLEIKNKRALLAKDLPAAYINGACHSLKKIQQRLARADKQQAAFIC